ncbi:hypothetical protein [Neobacillus vireti]|uniref:hypothetical protein n=1 Tax=Neobacillus vireti TaxID=220686 RepID=UPI002FFDF952
MLLIMEAYIRHSTFVDHITIFFLAISVGDDDLSFCENIIRQNSTEMTRPPGPVIFHLGIDVSN